MDILTQILIVLAVSVITIAVCRRLKLPPILGYLLVGLLAGPHALGIVSSHEGLSLIAEFGIAFLLFSIGLEFSLPHMIAMRRNVLGMGGLQVSITASLFAIILALLGQSIPIITVLAFALAMSSTAIVIKQLSEQSELHSEHGKIALGVLILQDFVAVPILILVSALAESLNITNMSWIIGKSMVALTLLIVFGHFVLPRLFKEIAQSRSPELFTLTTLLVIIAASTVAHLLGLPLALGSFVAGMMLGESEYRFQIESDIRPFRDVLMGLFFITVGLLINPGVFISDWHLIVLFALTIMVLKGSIVFLCAVLLKNPIWAAIRSALVLAHVGEFGFAIMTLAISLNLLPPEQAEIAIAVSILTLFIAPILVAFNQKAVEHLPKYRYDKLKSSHDIKVAVDPIKDHIIICGFGRVGQTIAHLLLSKNVDYVALDMEPKRISDARQAGELVFYGNSSDEEIMKAAKVKTARMVVITYKNHQNALKTLALMRRMCPSLPVIVRTEDELFNIELREAGASEVILETLESGLALGLHALLIAGQDPLEVVEATKAIRQNHYHSLEAFFQGEEDSKEAFTKRALQSVTVEEGSPAIGQTLGALSLEECTLEVNALRRDGIRGEVPDLEMILREGDVIIVNGAPNDIKQFEQSLRA